ncbi:MAG: hypothetical protein N2595_06305 [bacterium]|nr:hypothetical protein [bacterium]
MASGGGEAKPAGRGNFMCSADDEGWDAEEGDGVDNPRVFLV